MTLKLLTCRMFWLDSDLYFSSPLETRIPKTYIKGFTQFMLALNTNSFCQYSKCDCKSSSLENFSLALFLSSNSRKNFWNDTLKKFGIIFWNLNTSNFSKSNLKTNFNSPIKYSSFHWKYQIYCSGQYLWDMTFPENLSKSFLRIILEFFGEWDDSSRTFVCLVSSRYVHDFA